jgi:hypothetical protein
MIKLARSRWHGISSRWKLLNGFRPVLTVYAALSEVPTQAQWLTQTVNPMRCYQIENWQLTTDSSTTSRFQSTRTMQSSPSCSSDINLTSSRASYKHHQERAPRARAKSMSGTRSTPPCRWTLMGGWDGCVTQNDSQRHCLNVSYANARSNITNQQALTAYAAKSTFAFQHELHFLQQP